MSTTERKSRPDKSKTRVLRTRLNLTRCLCVNVCVCPYLLCRVVCCGQQMADVPACPNSSVHRCPPPGSANGSGSTAQLCGKGRRSPTPHCHKHTDKENRGPQYGSYYDKLLLNSIPDGGIKEEHWKCLTQNRLQTFSSQTFFFPLFCWVCKLTKLNDREMREIC